MDLWQIIEQSRPPDEDATWMLERAFLTYQIDALAYQLALIWVEWVWEGRTMH